MKNIDVVALLNQKNAASKKASKAQLKVNPTVEETVNVEQEQEMLAEGYAPSDEVAPENSAFGSFKETKVGRTAEAVWKKAAENKKEIALVAAGITIVAVVAGVVRHKRRTNILKSFNEDK